MDFLIRKYLHKKQSLRIFYIEDLGYSRLLLTNSSLFLLSELKFIEEFDKGQKNIYNDSDMTTL